MSRPVAILLALAVGGLVGLQPPANASVSHHLGDLGAAFFSVAVTFAVIAVVFLAFGDFGRLSALGDFRPAWTIGGLGGAAVVAVALIIVRPLGAGAVISLLVASQVVISVVADRFGWFGLHHVGLSAGRVAGVVLVVAGTALVTRS